MSDRPAGRGRSEPAPDVGAVPPERSRLLVQRLELAGLYQRAARARQRDIQQLEAAALEQLVVLGALTPGQLAHRLGLTSGGATALTTRLRDAGWVAREQHPIDRRMRVLTATAAARALMAEHQAPILAPTAQAISLMSDSDVAALVRALELLITLKERAAADTPGPTSRRREPTYKPDLLM